MPTLKLTGTAGLVSGSAFSLPQGGEAVLGRSRRCGVSLAGIGRGPEARSASPAGRAFRSVSREHATIRFKGASELEIVDRSRHGTFVDGDRIDTVILTDLATRPHTLRLGTAETFRLEVV